MEQKQKIIDWHRLFGLTLTDFFADSPFMVELEKDLSLKRQLLDVVVIRKKDGEIKGKLPDGLENLAEHNLLSYKSMREPFDDWVLKELTGHYVNYRKQVSPSWDKLLPEEKFGLYGISTRFPQKLSSQIRPERFDRGIYDIIRGTDNIRLIVLSEIPRKKQNAIWHLFSGIAEDIEFAASHYRKHLSEMSTIIYQLFETYKLEGINMPYTMEDFRKDFVMNHLNILSPDDRLRGLSPDEVLKQYSPDDRLRGLSPDEVLKQYSPDDRLRGLSTDEVLKRYSPDDRLKGLSLKEIKEYLQRVQI
jgi:hypothetical protein